MINLLVSPFYDPAINLAVEEYLTFNYQSKNTTLFLWQNQNTIVVGRNQNTYAEINLAEAWKDGVKIIRRNTGGGTVYQDLGNICYSLIVSNDEDKINYQKALNPIVEFLRSKNLNASFSGRNDLFIDDYKVSGNAQLKTQTKTLIHGTLLFDVDLFKISKYLIVDEEKIKHQKIRSKKSRVSNIKHFFIANHQEMTLQNFMDSVIQSYVQNQEINQIQLTDEDIIKINQLKLEKYDRWEWNFGKNSEFTLSKKEYLEGKGFINIKMNVAEGLIKEIKIYGDFLGTKGTEDLESSLINCRFDKSTIYAVLKQKNLLEIFSENFLEEDFLNIMFK